MAQKIQKTNVCRLLDAAEVAYELIEYAVDESDLSATHVAEQLGEAVDAYARTTGACGGIDFWGNCWEWTSTQNDLGEYIVKGGAWDTSRDECRTEYSDDTRNGLNGYQNVGFRVVRTDL